MKGSEFIRKVKKLAKERGIEAYVDKKRGKGSHVTLYFGEISPLSETRKMN
jgi:mRNA interferase HicA